MEREWLFRTEYGSTLPPTPVKCRIDFKRVAVINFPAERDKSLFIYYAFAAQSRGHRCLGRTTLVNKTYSGRFDDRFSTMSE